MEVLRRIKYPREYLIKTVVSEQNTFPRYRAGQSRVSTRGPLLTTRANKALNAW